MSEVMGLVIDVAVLCALAFTLFHGFRLSRKLEDVRADRKAFDQMIVALNLAASRAEAATQALKAAAVESGDKLQDKINAARALEGELEIVVEAGDSLAERLTGLAEKGRRAHAPEEAVSAPPQERVSGAQPRSRAEKELLDALKARQQS